MTNTQYELDTLKQNSIKKRVLLKAVVTMSDKSDTQQYFPQMGCSHGILKDTFKENSTRDAGTPQSWMIALRMEDFV